MIREILEYLGLGGVILVISLVTLTKLALGAIVTLVGAFFPSKQNERTTGQANVNVSKITATFRGSVRYGVIVAGILLIISGIVDGLHNAN